MRNHIVIPKDPSTGPSLILDVVLLFLPPLGTLAGVYFLFRRLRAQYIRRQYRDFRHYAAIIGDRSAVSVRELATRVNKSTDDVIKDLQVMIDQNILDPRCYIDRNALLLYLQDSAVETGFAQAPRVKKTIDVHPEPVKPEPAREAPRPARPAPAPQKSYADSADFEAKLREIRRLNDEIQNPQVSQRIDRIGALTAGIFRVVQEQPERAEEVRRFMNYYLPTTLKLLKSYSLMEKQTYPGENILQSMKQIEDVLETLVHAFERQQDKLFKSETLDVETDISVLQTMLAADGLTGDGFRLSGQ